jgi:hypothetical protein
VTKKLAKDLGAPALGKGLNWRDEKNVGQVSRAYSAIRKATNEKEWLLRNSLGPHSLPDDHYPKSFSAPLSGKKECGR